jgi:hypothetical protein
LRCKGFCGTPGGTRTPNLLIRNQALRLPTGSVALSGVIEVVPLSWTLPSTGPTSTEGKAISAANAVKHGVYSERPAAIRRGPFEENPEEVDRYVSDIVVSLNPRDALEDAAAIRVASCYLRLVRLDRFEAEALAGDTAGRFKDGAVFTPGGSTVDPRVHTKEAAARAIDHTFERASRIDSRLAQGLERSLKVYAMLHSRSGVDANTVEVSDENARKRCDFCRLRDQDSQDSGRLTP